jgi:hypothetical protein
MELVGKLVHEHFGYRDVLHLREHGVLFTLTASSEALTNK